MDYEKISKNKAQRTNQGQSQNVNPDLSGFCPLAFGFDLAFGFCHLEFQRTLSSQTPLEISEVECLTTIWGNISREYISNGANQFCLRISRVRSAPQIYVAPFTVEFLTGLASSH